MSENGAYNGVRVVAFSKMKLTIRPPATSLHLTMKRLLSLATLAWIILGAPTQTFAAGFFKPTQAPFYIQPNEKISSITFNSGSAEDLQKSIDEAAKNNSGGTIVVEVKGTVTVNLTPLRLPSRINVKFGPGAAIKADSAAAAKSLIEISNAEFICLSSIADKPAILDGQGVVLTAISVKKSGRLNFDQLQIQNCKGTAVDFFGKDEKLVNQASSVTRCTFSNNPIGLRIQNTAGFVCLDNVFDSHSTTALDITSLNSVVAGNTFRKNAEAIKSNSNRGAITRNHFAECSVALNLDMLGENNLVYENTSEGPTALSVAGATQTFFQNKMAATVDIVERSISGSHFIQNPNFKVGSTADAAVFNPPTILNPHKDTNIAPGFGRYDLSFPPAGTNNKDETSAYDLAKIQPKLDKARTEHANDILVVTLKGTFVARTMEGLKLPDNTCVILDGTIYSNTTVARDPQWKAPWVRGAPTSQLIRMPLKGYSSFSGGTIDGGHQATYGIHAGFSAPLSGLIQSVTIQNCSGDGVYIKGRRNKDPLIVHLCTSNGSRGRGIWPHVCGPVYSLQNHCEANGKDGIDLDAGCKENITMFNTCIKNKRHGVFIEEATHDNIVFANELNENGGRGVHVWNEEVAGDSTNNCIIGNTCRGNIDGVYAGARAKYAATSPNKGEETTIFANRNFFFNNLCADNKRNGIGAGNNHAVENFFSQSITTGNTAANISSSDSAQPIFLNSGTPTGNAVKTVK